MFEVQLAVQDWVRAAGPRPVGGAAQNRERKAWAAAAEAQLSVVIDKLRHDNQPTMKGTK